MHIRKKKNVLDLREKEENIRSKFKELEKCKKFKNKFKPKRFNSVEKKINETDYNFYNLGFNPYIRSNNADDTEIFDEHINFIIIGGIDNL